MRRSTYGFCRFRIKSDTLTDYLGSPAVGSQPNKPSLRLSQQVRTRDAKTFEVVVDRRSYDSWGNGKLDHEFDYASATEGATMMNTLRRRQASRANNLLESTYEWAVKMGEN